MLHGAGIFTFITGSFLGSMLVNIPCIIWDRNMFTVHDGETHNGMYIQWDNISPGGKCLGYAAEVCSTHLILSIAISGADSLEVPTLYKA